MPNPDTSVLKVLFHHGFEHTGGDVGAEHAGYEAGWGMTQLSALKELVEGDTLEAAHRAPAHTHQRTEAGDGRSGR